MWSNSSKCDHGLTKAQKCRNALESMLWVTFDLKFCDSAWQFLWTKRWRVTGAMKILQFHCHVQFHYPSSWCERIIKYIIKINWNTSINIRWYVILCWKYEQSKQNKNEKQHNKNRLWIKLEQLIDNTLDDGKNKQKWIWFKQHLLSSIIWHEIVLVSQSDPDLKDGINGISGIGDDNYDSSNASSNGIEIISHICECGHKYDLTAPTNVYLIQHYH